MNLTPRQLDVLVAIRNYRHLHGYSPTMQELADQLGTSKVTIFEHVGALEKKRVLRRDKHKARSLEIVSEPSLEWTRRSKIRRVTNSTNTFSTILKKRTVILSPSGSARKWRVLERPAQPIFLRPPGPPDSVRNSR